MTIYHLFALLTFNLLVGSFSKKSTVAFFIFFSVVFSYTQTIQWFDEQEQLLNPIILIDQQIEAENAQLVGTAVALLDASASNGSFVNGAFNQTNYIRYSVVVPASQDYQISYAYSLANVLTDRNLYIYIGGELVHTEFMQTTGGASDYVTVSFNIPLETGLNELDIFSEIGSFRHDSLSIYGESLPSFDNITLIQLIIGSVIAWICVLLKDLINVFR